MKTPIVALALGSLLGSTSLVSAASLQTPNPRTPAGNVASTDTSVSGTSQATGSAPEIDPAVLKKMSPAFKEFFEKSKSLEKIDQAALKEITAKDEALAKEWLNAMSFAVDVLKAKKPDLAQLKQANSQFEQLKKKLEDFRTTFKAQAEKLNLPKWIREEVESRIESELKIINALGDYTMKAESDLKKIQEAFQQ